MNTSIRMRKIEALITLLVMFFSFFLLHTISGYTMIDPQKESEPPLDNDIPLPLNQDVLDIIFFFQTERRHRIEKALSLMDSYLPRIKEIFLEEGIPEVLAYLPFIESAYDPLAKSSRGARGIWQFMPSTAKLYGLRVDYWIDERAHPEKSCRAAARYLKDHYRKFGDWTLAIASYNAGPTRIKRASNKLNTIDFWKIKKSRYIKGQTKKYIPAFIAGVYIAKNPEHFGFSYQKLPSEAYDIVEIPEMTEISIIARCAGTDVTTLKRLNPELRRQFTPRRYNNYPMRVPAGTAELFRTEFTKIRPEDRIKNLYYMVKEGDTLSKIGRKYGVSVDELMAVNSILSSRALKAGSVIIVPVLSSDHKSSLISEMEKTAKTVPAPDEKFYANYKKGAQVEYKVRSGDSLYLIAKRLRTDIYSICKWNKMPETDVLQPGRKLLVYYAVKIQPKEEPARKTDQGQYLTYTVRQGDTLYDIAKNYNVSIAMLKSANKIRGSRLYPGDKLLIPTEKD